MGIIKIVSVPLAVETNVECHRNHMWRARGASLSEPAEGDGREVSRSKECGGCFKTSLFPFTLFVQGSHPALLDSAMSRFFEGSSQKFAGAEASATARTPRLRWIDQMNDFI